MEIEFEQYSIALMRFALSLTGDHAQAEDLVQETMLRGIREQRAVEARNPRAWLFTVAINLWRDQCRKQQRLPRVEPLHLVDTLKTSKPNRDFEQSDHLQHVLDCFQDLPNRQREVLYLRTLEGFSIAEIAGMLNTTTNNVKATLSVARKRLRERVAHSPEGRVES